MYRFVVILLMLLLNSSLLSYGQEGDFYLQPNRGQWEEKIIYKVELTQGNFYVEKDQFTYALNNYREVYHSAHEGTQLDVLEYHTIYSHFLNSSWKGEVEEQDSSKFYQNYFLGKDEAKWRSKVYSYKRVKMLDFYPRINLILEIQNDAVKYSFEVLPGGNPSQIQIRHEGMSNLSVKEKEVELLTRFGVIQERGLHSWLASGDEVETNYERNGDVVSFQFPNGYDEQQTLIIDPYLTFSTFTGATSDNWGFTATPDDEGNLYAGGIVFGPNYPITTGAYDENYSGGEGNLPIDICISKFSVDGSQLLYSTFLGGTGNETPNSIIVDENDDLYILGISTSSDYPVLANAFQTTYNGGATTVQIAIRFEGSDIIVSKLSADGASLLASTYMGGEENDGLNISSLNYNYGDVFRGEINIDNNGNIVFASTTQSPDFPIVNGSTTFLNGAQDAVIVKMTPDLSTVIWSTYFGGVSADAGFSIQVNSHNNLLVTGGTASFSLPFTGGYQSFYQGGTCDGYVVEIDGNTSQVLHGTYIGTGEYDQSFFVQLDDLDQVYVFGQTQGDMLISPGVYSNPNSGQFIQQYSPDLSTLNWSTIVGGGHPKPEISPTAFLVSKCREIYYTGWGGVVNQQNSQATGSTTNGFPTTPDAFQSNTNGSNFYIGVLSENAEDLTYGTFMGGTNGSYNHVDGGTSRFDKYGRVYHAVCGACGGNSHGFTTTPGAYSETNNSSNCNMAAWKFDLGAIQSALAVPDVLICLPDSVHFTNNSKNGTNYEWDFGDGTTSTEFEPSHFYPNVGTYEVRLIVKDERGCFDSDTTYLVIDIGDFHGDIISPTTKTCPGVPFQLEASGGSKYAWSPAAFLDDSTSATPMATIFENTEFEVIVSDSCGTDTLKVVLEVFDVETEIISDTVICLGSSIQLWADGGGSYLWSSAAEETILSPLNQAVIRVEPEATTEYEVEIATPDGCVVYKKVKVVVIDDIPLPILEDSVKVCYGESIVITASGGDQITWSPTTFISPSTGSEVTASPMFNQLYYVDFTNACGTVRDSVFVEVIRFHPSIAQDTMICPNETALLWASGGVSYSWNPSESLSNPMDSITYALPVEDMIYEVVVTDENGCVAKKNIGVYHFPKPSVYVVNNFLAVEGEEIKLEAVGSGLGGMYYWDPPEFLSCVNCQLTIATPPGTMEYTVTYIDENGCPAENKVLIAYKPLLYVPNTFTPDKNGHNEFFFAIGVNIMEFEMSIFNRWGELIFESHDIHTPWDGTYKGNICPDGTYVWKITYKGINPEKEELVGHVNLLR